MRTDLGEGRHAAVRRRVRRPRSIPRPAWYLVLGRFGMVLLGMIAVSALSFLVVQGVAWLVTTPNGSAGGY